MTFCLVILTILTFLSLSSPAYGWGLATHMELAESLLNGGGLIASGVGAILLRNRKDFILGNLLADVMVAKKVTRRRKASHDWCAGLRLLEGARKHQNQAFAYGFLAHLAADTVAHNRFVPDQLARSGRTGFSGLPGHLYWELMADMMTDPKRRNCLRKLLNAQTQLHDQHLEEFLYPQMVWFGFNRSVFHRINRVAHGNPFLRAVKTCHTFCDMPLIPDELQGYKIDAYERMLDIVLNGEKSSLLNEDPNGCG